MSWHCNKEFVDLKVSLYKGSFPYIFLLLGQKFSFVIPRTTLYRGSLYRGSAVKSLHSISTHYHPIVVNFFPILQSVTTRSKVRLRLSFLRRFSEVCTVHVYRVGKAKRTIASDLVKTKCQQVKDSCFEKKALCSNL